MLMILFSLFPFPHTKMSLNYADTYGGVIFLVWSIHTDLYSY